MKNTSGIKLCFVDLVGLRYDGSTLKKKGLGGSESAVIYMASELAKLGFDVTVFNRCDQEGIHDGVRYLELFKAGYSKENYDVVIVSRSTIPYIPLNYRDDILKTYNYDLNMFHGLISRCNYKVLWLHDTFCIGDEWLESLLVDGYFDELFTLSDWHTHYVCKAEHGHRARFYEVMKRKVYQTRNGLFSYHDEVDIAAKDKNLFVYNASISKGMFPLLNDCWPRIKKEIPEAKLVVIGGYYRSVEETPDQFELDYMDLRDKYNGRDGITFTGIITQKEISDILCKASLFIYPGVYPETFGISTLEAINYNVPLVGCRFGALEEIAAEGTSYLINFPFDYDENQIHRFVEAVKIAYYDDYQRQQKMYYCNAFKPYLGWDKVALQWKQHLYRKLGLYLDIGELKDVRRTNGSLIKLFGRRHINPEDYWEDYSMDLKNKLVVVTPVYNSEEYIEDCILSVASQLYDNYEMIILDDLSTDNTYNVANNTIKNLPAGVKSKFKLVKNKDKMYALGNQITTIKALNPEDIVVLLDGDDRLLNDPDIFNYINQQYVDGAKFTYGSCYSLADKIALIAQPYPKEVHWTKAYRGHLFNWGMPYTHLRTFKKEIFDKVDESVFRYDNGEYFRAGGDNALFYPLIEQCDESEIRPIQRVLYIYNDLNPLNDYKVNPSEQNSVAKKIRGERINELGITKELYNKVMRREPKSIQEFKSLLINRKYIWLDPPENFQPRLGWLLTQVAQKPKESKILDIGSWTGGVSQGLYDRGYRDITCLDISKEVVRIGQEVRPHLKWLQGDIDNYETEEKYDIILAMELLEHSIDPERVLRKIKNWLTDDGIILLTVPTEEFVFSAGVGEHISEIKEDTLRLFTDDIKVLNGGDFEWYTAVIRREEKIQKGKRVLIALPTAKNIETDTFLSLYNQDIPEGVSVKLLCFYGYRVDQVRNLIAHTAVQDNFDYVFCVDSDIVLPWDALSRLLSHDKDLVSGVYVQRKPNECIPEVYINGKTELENIDSNTLLQHDGLIEVAGFGFGCVLIKCSVLADIGYPQFEYHPTLDFAETTSEDIDFCNKAKSKGYKLYVDPTLQCDHIATTKLRLE